MSGAYSLCEKLVTAVIGANVQNAAAAFAWCNVKGNLNIAATEITNIYDIFCGRCNTYNTGTAITPPRLNIRCPWDSTTYSTFYTGVYDTDDSTWRITWDTETDTYSYNSRYNIYLYGT
jgi:hypothetical protein